MHIYTRIYIYIYGIWTLIGFVVSIEISWFARWDEIAFAGGPVSQRDRIILDYAMPWLNKNTFPAQCNLLWEVFECMFVCSNCNRTMPAGHPQQNQR